MPSAARVDLAGEASATATPLMSHLPSSANLVALDEEPDAAARAAGRKGGVACLSRAPLLLLLLYGFVCSLDLLTTSFRLMAGKAAGTCFPPFINIVCGCKINCIMSISDSKSPKAFDSIFLPSRAKDQLFFRVKFC